MKIITQILIIFFLFPLSCTIKKSSFKTIETDVLVIGGGASGVAAAIQAARRDIKTTLIEYTPWLGGMLTSAGVSATDGNHRLPSGLWGEFRDSLYVYYGGPDAVSTGWVSNTHFEPHIGNRIWNKMADKEWRLSRHHGYHVTQVLVKKSRVLGAVFENSEGEKLTVHAKITIDATELGDVLALAGADFYTGQNSSQQAHNPNIQDLTYAAIIQDYSPGKAPQISRPADYDSTEFACICKEVCPDTTMNVPDCETFLNYAHLPNNKYLLNWPNNGNDYFLNPIPMSFEERQEAYQAAKSRTLALLYFMQTEMGYDHLGLAEDEFPTADQLPLIPYHREARRLHGMEQLRVEDLIDPYANPGRSLYKQAIAVGDYPLDHHHGKNPNAEAETFPAIPSFSVPYYALVPAHVDGLLVAEKSISVSHVVNGATRLQPCVILIGQAAGMAASLCIGLKQQPREIPVSSLQQLLLEADCWLLPFIDVNPEDEHFEAVQRAAVGGYMRGKGVPYKWANQTWFYPDSLISPVEIEKIITQIPGNKRDLFKVVYNEMKKAKSKFTRKEIAMLLHDSLK